MIRSLLIASLFVSTSALATGEKISVTGAAAPLKEMLCISMNCVAGGSKDFTVSGRAVKGGVEFTVTSVSGQPRLTHVAPLNASNQVSSTDLVHAIERGPIAPPAVKKVATAKKSKARPKAFFARR
jgi:hypothetical protein